MTHSPPLRLRALVASGRYGAAIGPPVILPSVPWLIGYAIAWRVLRDRLHCVHCDTFGHATTVHSPAPNPQLALDLRPAREPLPNPNVAALMLGALRKVAPLATPPTPPRPVPPRKLVAEARLIPAADSRGGAPADQDYRTRGDDLTAMVRELLTELYPAKHPLARIRHAVLRHGPGVTAARIDMKAVSEQDIATVVADYQEIRRNVVRWTGADRAPRTKSKRPATPVHSRPPRELPIVTRTGDGQIRVTVRQKTYTLERYVQMRVRALLG